MKPFNWPRLNAVLSPAVVGVQKKAVIIIPEPGKSPEQGGHDTFEGRTSLGNS